MLLSLFLLRNEESKLLESHVMTCALPLPLHILHYMSSLFPFPCKIKKRRKKRERDKSTMLEKRKRNREPRESELINK